MANRVQVARCNMVGELSSKMQICATKRFGLVQPSNCFRRLHYEIHRNDCRQSSRILYFLVRNAIESLPMLPFWTHSGGSRLAHAKKLHLLNKWVGNLPVLSATVKGFDQTNTLRQTLQHTLRQCSGNCKLVSIWIERPLRCRIQLQKFLKFQISIRLYSDF